MVRGVGKALKPILWLFSKGARGRRIGRLGMAKDSRFFCSRHSAQYSLKKPSSLRIALESWRFFAGPQNPLSQGGLFSPRRPLSPAEARFITGRGFAAPLPLFFEASLKPREFWKAAAKPV